MKVQNTIIDECRPLLEAEVAKLNKRALKLGCTPLQLTFGASYMRARDDAGVNVVDSVTDIVIEGEPIKLNGWRFLGRVEAVLGADNLIFTVPGEKAPEEYRTCSAYRCEHCGQDRLRKYTWIVQHDDGSKKQVGSSCMDDFLSARNPERAVAWWMASMEKLLAYLKDLESKTPQHVTTGFHGVSRPMLISAYSVLKQACQVVRLNGKYEFDNDDADGTPWKVWRAIFSSDNHGPMLPEDLELADQVVAFVLARTNTADYFKNLGVMFTADKVSVRNIKYICSSVYSYQKHMRVNAVPAAAGKNEHIGTVGYRLRDIQLTVDFVLPVTSTYHETYDYLVILKDAEGRTFKWKKTSAGVIAKGDQVKLTGTIKAHELYKGTNQTVLTRCSVEQVQHA